jgi:endo-1,4-beta-xylanase
VYGWSTNPLVEYYIMEDSHAFPNTDALKATYTSDGATYNMYEDTRVNEPSIQGTSTFNQYISVRQSPRTSGTVTVANHFAQWASHGMPLGSLSYQVIAVEGWGGSGSASQSVSNTGTGSSAPAPTTPATGGSCSALFGQCGGIGWTGAKCCSAGTCKVANAYYSQCLS